MRRRSRPILDRRRRGTIAIVTAMAAPVLLGFAALSIDLGWTYQQSDRLGQASQAASMAVARATTYGINTKAALQRVASEAASQAGVPNASVSVTGKSPPAGMLSVLDVRAEDRDDYLLRVPIPGMSSGQTLVSDTGAGIVLMSGGQVVIVPVFGG